MKESWMRRALTWLGAERPETSLPDAQHALDRVNLHDRVRDLNSAQLCRAWRISFLAAISARTPSALEDLASKRRMYLEELELRNPAGFRAWLDTAPAASSDPEPYLLHHADREKRGYGLS